MFFFEFLVDALEVFRVYNVDSTNVSLTFFFPVTTSSTGTSSLAAKDAYK